jgi:hypothetical protein
MNPLQNIKDYQDKQAEQALVASRHDEKLQGFVAVAQTMQDSIQSLIKYLDGKTTKTEVINQLENLASPEDIEKVVNAVNALDDSVKAQSIDFEPVTAGLAKLEKHLADIPKELPSFEQIDELKITNLDEIDFTTLEKAFSDGISTIVKSIKTPIVNVDAPQVNVTTDVKDVVKPLKDLLEAFKGFKVEIPETDMSGVEKKLEQSNKYLKEISEKRFGGGSGGGHSTPYQNAEGRATYVELLNNSIPFITSALALRKFVDGTDLYIAESAPGALQTEEAWRIQKVDSDANIYWKSGSGAFIHTAIDLTDVKTGTFV